jgi:membrane associated rhomboid family serine protease
MARFRVPWIGKPARFGFSARATLEGPRQGRQGESMRPARERIFNAPRVILWIVGLLVAIEAIGNALTPAAYLEMLRLLAFVPGRLTFAFDPDLVAAFLSETSRRGDAVVEQFFLGDGTVQWWTLLTYALLHGSWLHVGMNCLWLAAFGAAVARRFGTGRFLLFCAVTALAGAAMHYVTHRTDLIPMIGASAVVSGAMGAAIRFVFQPGAPLGESLGFASRTNEPRAYRQPALPLREIATNSAAMSFLVFWFLANFLFGTVSLPVGAEDAAIAWEAHIGGFLVGLLGFRFFDPAPSKVKTGPSQTRFPDRR